MEFGPTTLWPHHFVVYGLWPHYSLVLWNLAPLLRGPMDCGPITLWHYGIWPQCSVVLWNAATQLSGSSTDFNPTTLWHYVVWVYRTVGLLMFGLYVFWPLTMYLLWLWLHRPPCICLVSICIGAKFLKWNNPFHHFMSPVDIPINLDTFVRI